MKNLVDKTIKTNITSEGLEYTIECGEYDVIIINSAANLFYLCIAPANEPNSLIIDSVPFHTFIEALDNADEIIDELNTTEECLVTAPENEAWDEALEPPGTWHSKI